MDLILKGTILKRRILITSTTICDLDYLKSNFSDFNNISSKNTSPSLNKNLYIKESHKMKVQQNSQYVDILGGRLNKAVNNYFKNHHHYINMHHKSLNNLSYKNVLSRGYAVIHGDSGIISSYHQSKTTLPERIEFHDGVLKLK